MQVAEYVSFITVDKLAIEALAARIERLKAY